LKFAFGGQALRLAQILVPIMMASQELKKPDSVKKTIVEETHEGKTRWIVMFKSSYSTKEEAEKFMQFDDMLDKV